MRSSEVLLAITGLVALVGIALIGSIDDSCTNQVVVEDEYEDGSTIVTVYDLASTGDIHQERHYRIIR